jgi:hypothetical protein
VIPGKMFLKENLRGLHQKESKFKYRDIARAATKNKCRIG